MTRKTLCLAIVGCGAMGGALLARWGEALPDAQFLVLEPRDLPLPPAVEHFREAAPFCEALAGADALILAVKPQVLPQVTKSLDLPKDLPVASIAAGVPVQRLQDLLPGPPVTRAMPNLPAALGRGVTALAGAQTAAVEAAFAAVGAVEWMPEAQFDAFTALAGSGPAYVFYLTEVLEKAGARLGLEPALSARLARRTVEGAAALMESRANAAPGALREAVTSAGGTTAAALEVLADGRVEAVFAQALAAAAARSRALNP
ncbi:MAG TPA: pyrroline-5-carboxylate reductase [Rhodospirillaceae bacterium]|nr:pyrroline-5-carboxylate reductase [Rhodospirillaceae bacterium]